jgi:hypothetical protein
MLQPNQPSPVITRIDLSDFKIAGAMNGIFLLLIALLLWPMGKAGLAWHLIKGYLLFWIVAVVTFCLGSLIERLFRVENDPPSNVYVLMNLVLSATLQVGWCAFAALTVINFTLSAPLWVAIVLYLIGFISSYLMNSVVNAFYHGVIYRKINALLALIAYLIFAIWPASAWFLYGWFFNLF